MAHVGCNVVGKQYYINIDAGSWLSSISDELIGSGGASKDTWEGWYPSREKAQARLDKYNAGIPFSPIFIGGE